MKIKLAVLEKDKRYLKRIMSVLSVKYADKVEVYSFTDVEMLLSAFDTIRIDMLVVYKEEEIEELYQSCIAEPGLYLPYMEGYYQWMDLEQGWKDSEKDSKENFMDAVLSLGKLPYEILWKNLE